MKRIKSFKLFESGLPYSYIEEIKIAINELLSEERFQPHIDEDSDWDFDENEKAKKRKFSIGVDANESKFGVQFDVSFRTDGPVDPNLVNEEIKYSWRDIMDVIMDKSKSIGQIKLTKFGYFNQSAEGRKNGHTKEIEDVTDELVDAIESSVSAVNSIRKIYFQFTITN
jgi:hypothetical protein